MPSLVHCRPAQEKEKRSITDVGDGMLEGAGAFGSSVLRGFRGLIEKPLQGAQQAGAKGARAHGVTAAGTACGEAAGCA